MNKKNLKLAQQDIDEVLKTVEELEVQIDDLISEKNKRTEKKERVLVTTLTKKMAEDLTS